MKQTQQEACLRFINKNFVIRKQQEDEVSFSSQLISASGIRQYVKNEKSYYKLLYDLQTTQAMVFTWWNRSDLRLVFCSK